MLGKFRKLLFYIRNYRELYPAVSWAANELYHNRLALLANHYGSDKGCGFHNYTRIYNTFLKNYKNERITLLEIGLLKHSEQRRHPKSDYEEAPSLSMWAKYFPKGHIVGFDIASFKYYQNKRCHVIQGDQSKVVDLQKIVDHTGGASLDFIIDDALHHTKHQQISLGFLFPQLKPGGLYFIEDLHFDPMPEGKIESDSMLDILEDIAKGNIPKTPFLDKASLNYLTNNIENIWFFDSNRRDITGRYAISVIQKKKGKA